MPLTVSASAGDLEHLNILEAGSLKIRVFLKLSVDLLISCFSVAHFPPLTFFGTGFAFAFVVFSHYIMSLLSCY